MDCYDYWPDDAAAIEIAVAVIADENDAAVAGRSAGPPLRAYSVAVAVAVEQPRRRRRPLA